MKNLYIFLLMIAFTNFCFGQDSLKTEIVFTTTGNTPMKVYRLVKEKFIYYGADNSYGADNYYNGHRHYPYVGTSYEREYMATAPASILIPNNREESFVIVDNKDLIYTRFTTTTDGRKQVWNLIPTGENYNLGRSTLIAGVAGLITSGVLIMVASQQNFKYKQEMEQYRTEVNFQSNFNLPGSGQITTSGNQTFILNGRTIIIPSGTSFTQPGFVSPTPPKDNRMGFTIPVITSTLSLTAIITGFRVMFNNSPKAVQLE